MASPAPAPTPPAATNNNTPHKAHPSWAAQLLKDRVARLKKAEAQVQALTEQNATLRSRLQDKERKLARLEAFEAGVKAAMAELAG